jgi:DNA-binding MarR family transcriptional regulator
MTRRLVASRLITLIKVLYGSAGPAYRAVTGLSDFEWRVVMQVGDRGPITLTALATLLGQDKGQLSHAVQGLVDSRLLLREQLRAPIALTKRGRDMFDRIVKLSRARNTVLVRDLNEAERMAVCQLLPKVHANARQLLSREQALKVAREDPDEADGEPISASTGTSQSSHRKRAGTERRLVAQDLFALHSLMQRSAAITFRRETGLLDFEWRVLTQVGENAPLTLIQLVPMLSRDKSQVGRTLTSLEARGLVSREKIGGGRHVLVGITEQGRQVYERLAELATARNSALLNGLSAREQQTLMDVFDKLTARARTMLEKARKD